MEGSKGALRIAAMQESIDSLRAISAGPEAALQATAGEARAYSRSRAMTETLMREVNGDVDKGTLTQEEALKFMPYLQRLEGSLRRAGAEAEANGMIARGKVEGVAQAVARLESLKRAEEAKEAAPAEIIKAEEAPGEPKTNERAKRPAASLKAQRKAQARAEAKQEAREAGKAHEPMPTLAEPSIGA